MGSLGGDDGEPKSSIERSSLADHAHMETQSDSQISTPPLFGGNVKVGDVDELLQSTEPFDNTAMADDAFETQVVNLAEETQVIDFCGENQFMDFGGETQVMNIGGETQVFDDVNCIEHMETQLLDVFADELVSDSNGDETDGTEVLDGNDELSDDELVGRDGGHSLDEKKVQCTSLCNEKGLTEQPDVSSNGQHNLGHHASTATPVAQGSPEPESGSGRMRFTSVGVASLRASGLAARNRALKSTSNGSCSLPSSSQSPKQFAVKDTAVSLMEVEGKVNQENALGCNEMVKGSENAIKCRIGNPAVRKLFVEDSDTVTMELPVDTNRGDEGENTSELPAYDLSGLSYVESQDPGELSQANALDFVDKFLRDNAMEFDNEVDRVKSASGNSNCVSSVKGPQRLAKKTTERRVVGEIGIYDWDDSREDEGGGDIFCRRKKEFFSVGSHGKRHRKSKTNGLDEEKANEVLLNGNNKASGLAYSDSRLMCRDLKVNDITVHEVKKKLIRNLVDELDKESDIHSSARQLEDNAIKADVTHMLDVGIDTQMAAEAMEALFHGEDVGNCDGSDAHEGIHRDSISLPKDSTGKKKKNIVCLEQPSSRKKARPSDVGVASRKSKRSRRVGADLEKESLVSSEEQFNNVMKQYQTNLVVTKSRKAKSKSKGHLNSNRSENFNKLPCDIIEQRKVGPLTRGCNEFDKYHGTARSSGGFLVNKQDIQVEIGNLVPIARRTRSKVSNFSASSDCREEMNNLTQGFSTEDKRKRSRGVKASNMLNVRSSNFGDTQSVIAGKVKANQQEHSNHKVAAPTNINEIGALSWSRGRRSHRNLSNQLRVSCNLDVPCEPSIGPEEAGQSITGHKRSCKETRSSTCVCPVMSSVGQNLEARLLQERLDRVHSGEAKSAYPSTGKKASPIQSKPSVSSCETPLNCTVPAKDASPICMGNEYFNQSCKRDRSTPNLLREIRRLGASCPEPATPSKDLRKRREMTDVRVLYSHHLDDDIIKQQKKIVARLGVSIASSVTDATHFIADEFVRTRNMLEAIASGKPVVTHLWLDGCGQANCFIDEKNYILRDAKKEKEFGFSMPTSLALACRHPLLKGCRVLITPNTKPGKEIILSLVNAVQGQAVERIGRSGLKDDKVPDDLLILSCEEDYAICVPFLEKGAAIYSSELLLNGIVTQKLQYERHRIFADHVKRTRSTIWMKKDGNNFIPVTKIK